MVVAGVQTYRHARGRRMEPHRAWALRLFSLAIGSWLYRMEYGFWLVLTGGLWHTSSLDGPFDVVMVFFFYVPNLLVAELVIRGRRLTGSTGVQWLAALAATLATAFLVLATYHFTRYDWAPEILARLMG
jgi:hypothetical protein